MRNLFIVSSFVSAICAACAVTPDPTEETSAPVVDVALVRASVVKSMSRAPANLQVREHADGGRHVHITGGFQHATVLVRGDAGVQRHCLTDVAEAMRLVEEKGAP